MTISQLILLSFIQGVTEFLPVSSSSHTILISNLFNFNVYDLLLDVSLHIGSFLAITFYFRSEIINFSKNKRKNLKVAKYGYKNLFRFDYKSNLNKYFEEINSLVK